MKRIDLYKRKKRIRALNRCAWILTFVLASIAVVLWPVRSRCAYCDGVVVGRAFIPWWMQGEHCHMTCYREANRP